MSTGGGRVGRSEEVDHKGKVDGCVGGWVATSERITWGSAWVGVGVVGGTTHLRHTLTLLCPVRCCQMND